MNPVFKLDILSVDPGTVNTGWSSCEYTAASEGSAGVLSLGSCGVSRVIDESGDDSIAFGVWKLVHVEWEQVLDKNPYTHVLIEYQYPIWEKPLVFTSMRNKLVEMAIKSHFHKHNVSYVYSSAVKSKLKIGTGEYGANKTSVVRWAEWSFGREPLNQFWQANNVKTDQRHHVCDSLSQIVYWLQSKGRPIAQIRINENLYDFRQTFTQLHPGEQGPPLTLSPSPSHDGEDQGDRRDQPSPAGERTISSFFQTGSGHQRKKPRRQDPRKLETKRQNED